MCSTCFLLSIPTTFSLVRTADPYWYLLLNSKFFYSIYLYILSLIVLLFWLKNLSISLLILAFALPRMFREYESKYNFLFDLGCRPLDPMVYSNFCSDREILCLKRYFYQFLSVLFIFFIDLNKLHCVLSLDFKISFSSSISSYMLCFLLDKSGLFYVHPQELLNRFPNIFQMAYCLKFLGLEP